MPRGIPNKSKAKATTAAEPIKERKRRRWSKERRAAAMAAKNNPVQKTLTPKAVNASAPVGTVQQNLGRLTDDPFYELCGVLLSQHVTLSHAIATVNGQRSKSSSTDVG